MTLRLVSQGGLLNNQLVKEDPLILDTMKEADDTKATFGDVGDVYPDADFNSETKYIRDSSPIAVTNFDGTAIAGDYDDTVLYAGTSGLGRYGVNTLGVGGLGMVSSLASWADNEMVRWHGASGGPTIVQGSSIFIDDSQNMTGLGNITFTGVMTAGSGPTTVTNSNGTVKGAAIETAFGGTALTITAGIMNHATSGVGAGTYTSVTVDVRGHVTGATNPGHIIGSGTNGTIPLWGAGGVVLGDSALTQSAGILTSSGNLSVESKSLRVIDSEATGVTLSAISSNSVSAGASSVVSMTTAVGGGDPYVRWTSGQAYVLGIDVTDSNKLVGSVGGSLGTANWLEVTTAGDTLLTGDVSVGGDLQVTGDAEITAGSLGVGRAPTVAGDFFSASNISVIIETEAEFASLDVINNAQRWRMGVRDDGTWSVRDVTGAKQVLQINTSGDVEVPAGNLLVGKSGTARAVVETFGDVLVGGTSTVVLTDDVVSTLGFLSNDIAGGPPTDDIVAAIKAIAEGAHVSGNFRAGLGFFTSTSSVLTERMRLSRLGDLFVHDGDIIATVGDVLVETGFVVLPKASTAGIKVDTASPTFGWADIIGDRFSDNTGATKPTKATYNGAVKSWKFGVGDEAYMNFHIPHDYKNGTDIFLHIHWSHISTLVTGGTVTFKVSSTYAKAHDQDAFDSPAVGTFVGSASTIQYRQMLTEVQYSDDTPAGLKINTSLLEPDGIIEMTFEVDANEIIVSSGGPPDIFIHHIDVHYQTTGLIGTKDKVPDFYV